MGNSIAQTSYPKDYFRNPLDIPITLAGNFGECRPGHFHSGIDIKTAGRENLPVFAAAEGYISRIKMEPGGFGHGLYITHPNGYTTLYAHLNNFTPAIQQYVRQEQYKKESWT
ncbi:peptidase, M23 family, partial [Ostertagia ostertagi]